MVNILLKYHKHYNYYIQNSIILIKRTVLTSIKVRTIWQGRVRDGKEGTYH